MLLFVHHHLGDLPGLNFSELALREIRFLSRFIGVTKWFFSLSFITFHHPVHNSGYNRPAGKIGFQEATATQFS